MKHWSDDKHSASPRLASRRLVLVKRRRDGRRLPCGGMADRRRRRRPRGWQLRSLPHRHDMTPISASCLLRRLHRQRMCAVKERDARPDRCVALFTSWVTLARREVTLCRRRRGDFYFAPMRRIVWSARSQTCWMAEASVTER